jgi:uncharacterized protein YkwD
MPAYRNRVMLVLLAFVISVGSLTLLAITAVPSRAARNGEKFHRALMPVVIRQKPPAPKTINALALLNEVRKAAGVPQVKDSAYLSDNCRQHARYMAENNLLTHDQNPGLPYASSAGQICAQHANAWLGSQRPDPGWDPDDSIKSWMGSVGHRLWLLYPTTDAVGYGFYTASGSNRAGAALDVLSKADFNADTAYSGWPVRYPAAGERYIPALRYPITLNWRYFGPAPKLQRTRLTGPSGQAIAHVATTTLAAGHKGIQLVPKANLPLNSLITVTISGTYEGQTFSHTWNFYTGGEDSRNLPLLEDSVELPVLDSPLDATSP